MSLGNVMIPRTVYSMERWRCRSLHVLWVLWWLSRVGRFGAAIPHEPWESFGFPRTFHVLSGSGEQHLLVALNDITFYGKVCLPREVFSMARWRFRFLHGLWVLWFSAVFGRIWCFLPA